MDTVADDGSPYDLFGCSVSISNQYALIGAFGDADKDGTSGSAYIFELMNDEWIQIAKLVADDGSDGDWFGYSVSISQQHALIGARNDDDKGTYSGSAYVARNYDSCCDVHANTINKTALVRENNEYLVNYKWTKCSFTFHPTVDPTKFPTTDPTKYPTVHPTTDPTKDPTKDPTNDPTKDPTVHPTTDPTKDPTKDPTNDPTKDPTVHPTTDPTIYPTESPTRLSCNYKTEYRLDIAFLVDNSCGLNTIECSQQQEAIAELLSTIK
eukprot:198510_1